jgi:large subunit ribosomal protein L25
MSTSTNTLKAEARERVGKGSARAIRRNGKLPAVIYGGKQPPVAITVPYKETFMRLHAGGFMTTILDIEVDGEKISVLPKAYQLDPVRDFLVHVDFLRVSKDTVVTVEVPVRFVGEEDSPGLGRGGVLNVVRHAIELHCPASNIPEYIEVPVGQLDIGDSVHISAVTLPKGVTPTITDRDFTIATIAAPAGLKSEAESEADESESE